MINRAQQSPQFLGNLRFRRDRGAALMLALFVTTLLMFIATEIMFETSVEYIVSTQSVNRVRAYWAARSGVEISLLRIHVYRQALSLAGQALPNPAVLNAIWNVPFAWPPPVPQNSSASDTGDLRKLIAQSALSQLKMSYLSTIESEGGKIDINDLGSPSRIMAETAKRQLIELLNNKMASDEVFMEQFRGTDFLRVIHNIADWIDADIESRNGGDEQSPYGERAIPGVVPANQPFKSIEELNWVAGMNDALFDAIAPAVTLYGSKGINVNLAPKEVFSAFGPAFTPERIDRIMQDRSDPRRAPFKSEDEFLEYLQSIGISGNPFDQGELGAAPLVFDPETIFRIRSTGQSGQARFDITAVVYDPSRVLSRLENALTAQASRQKYQNSSPAAGTTSQGGSLQSQPAGTTSQQTSTSPQAQTQTQNAPYPLRRPKIVLWNEQ